MSNIKIPRRKTYLDRADLEEMKKRQELINGFLLAAEALAMVKNTWFMQKLKKYDLDPKKEYTVDLSGKITEAIKQENGQNKH